MEAMQDDSTDIGTHGGASVPAKDSRRMSAVHHSVVPMPTRPISLDRVPTFAT
jgi:hypothetical protein